MVLRLHVVGPAFGLASADAECLAAITYLAYAVPPTEYELVATSPSGVPTRKFSTIKHRHKAQALAQTLIEDAKSSGLFPSA